MSDPSANAKSTVTMMAAAGCTENDTISNNKGNSNQTSDAKKISERATIT